MSSSNDCRPPEARGSDDDLRGLEILLVEDSQSVADALKQHLELFYICPQGKLLHTTGYVHDGTTLLYRARVSDCGLAR